MISVPALGAIVSVVLLAALVTGCQGTAPPVKQGGSGGRTEPTQPASATSASASSSTSAQSTATAETTTSSRKLSEFDAFWRDVLAASRAVPLRPEARLRGDLSTARVLVYDIYYSSLDGVRIHGFYARPRGPLKGRKLPAVALYHGYSDRAYSEWATRFAERGYAAVSISERGHGKSTRRVVRGKASVYKPGFPGLMVDGITDPRRYSMVGIVADSDRAIDFLVSRREVDPDRIGVTGGSMGGAMSIIVPALDRRVKAGAAGVPYLCDIPDSIERAKADPYLEVTRYLQDHPADRGKVMKTLDFVDARHFARGVRVPELVGVGMADYICPYQGIFKTYRRLRGPKEMLVRKDEGHVVLTGWRERVFEWMDTYVKQ